MTGSEIILLLCVAVSAPLSVYYMIIMGKKFSAEKRYFRLVFYILGSSALQIYLIVQCWKVVLKYL